MTTNCKRNVYLIDSVFIFSLPDVTCYEGRGENYRGPVSHTLSSHQCQSWSPVAEYEELSGGHNYCRNPGGLESQPWCFISDPQMRREVCDIPRCGKFFL